MSVARGDGLLGRVDQRSVTRGAGALARMASTGIYLLSIGIIVPALVLLLSLAAAQPVESQVPGASDYAACNREAPQAAKAGTDSPTKGDHVRADRERAGAVTTKSTEFTGIVIESSDPQIHGMEVEGAKDAAYQAAYRSCMRRKGF
jgi:hypothetical protein